MEQNDKVFHSQNIEVLFKDTWILHPIGPLNYEWKYEWTWFYTAASSTAKGGQSEHTKSEKHSAQQVAFVITAPSIMTDETERLGVLFLDEGALFLHDPSWLEKLDA